MELFIANVLFGLAFGIGFAVSYGVISLLIMLLSNARFNFPNRPPQ